MIPRPRIALLFNQSAENATLSYQHGWPRALLSSPWFDATPINLARRALGDKLDVAGQLATERYDAIVLLHSVFSNAQELRGPLLWLLARLSAPKVYFIGNEYKLMPEKMRFCRQLGVALLVTQSNDPRVLALYRGALGCAVTSIPNTGFDSGTFRPTTNLSERPIDIGYRSYEAPLYLGNNEKQEIARAWTSAAATLGLRADISLDPNERFDSTGYAAFLNRCRSQIGTESGGDYFDLDDTVRKLVIAYVSKHPSATWTEVSRDIFSTLPPGIPMRIISGRQVEAAACKTVQILFEGRYNDYLRPDEHYIPLRKDLGNLAEVAAKLRDDAFCRDLVENAYDLALQEFTYERLGERFARDLQTIL
jgi:hypothetical protein